MPETTVREELAWIRGLMMDSRRVLQGSWQHQALWGVLITLGLLGTWAAVGSGRANWSAPGWLVVITVGWVSSALLGRRMATTDSVRNQASGVFMGVWVGVGTTLTLLGTVGIYNGGLSPSAFPGIVAPLMGLGYFASGSLAGLSWLRWVGAGWWGVGVAMLVAPGPWTLLGLAGAFVVLALGPAVMLRRQEAHARMTA